jgi:hypothetical protein
LRALQRGSEFSGASVEASPSQVTGFSGWQSHWVTSRLPAGPSPSRVTLMEDFLSVDIRLVRYDYSRDYRHLHIAGEIEVLRYFGFSPSKRRPVLRGGESRTVRTISGTVSNLEREKPTVNLSLPDRWDNP